VPSPSCPWAGPSRKKKRRDRTLPAPAAACYTLPMHTCDPSASDIISFAERLIALLERTSVVATYKYAVLIGLMDLCMEHTTPQGAPSEVFTTRQLAEKVLGLYWPHTRAFRSTPSQRILKQNTGKQARILSDIIDFRQSLPDQSVALHRARLELPLAYQQLLDQIEWTLILMPLPRVQRVGGEQEELLYSIAWGIDVARGPISAYQRGQASDFDNRIVLKPGVASHLLRLNGLLRPLVYRSWTTLVARINRDLVDESRLEDFLFGRGRIALTPLAPALRDIQNNRCFYCDHPLGPTAQVDHFIPWARFPDDGIENLVLAHPRRHDWCPPSETSQLIERQGVLG